MSRWTDEPAAAVLQAIIALAVSVRDDGPDEVAEAAAEALAAAGGDATAALTIAAALIRVDEPIDAWWQRGLDPLGHADALCGSRAAYDRHEERGEVCDVCEHAERTRQQARTRAERRRRRAARKAGTPRGQLMPCGTHAAFLRHKRYGEPIDDVCMEADRTYERERARRRRAARATGAAA